MSSTATLVQAAAAVPYGQVFSTTVYLALLAGFVLFFRPLLVGIGRALYLTVRPRRSKAEQAARRALDEALALKRKLASLDPVDEQKQNKSGKKKKK
jgi:hypothetical protein